ncbi:helix-turn-helix domain-containing protein [Okeania sp. SIO3I5]|nr:helix-turn-helix domain-containing protein [Okeania sp. SIO3I5]
MISIKTKLKVNNKQKTILAKHAGVARHAYNWGIEFYPTVLCFV